VRRYQRGAGHEIETCSLSYMEQSGFVRMYSSEYPGRCETQCGEWPAKTVAEGRAVFQKWNDALYSSGWRIVGTEVRGLDDANGDAKPEQG
jgi:hypothetical protein